MKKFSGANNNITPNTSLIYNTSALSNFYGGSPNPPARTSPGRVVPRDVKVDGIKKYITAIYIVEGLFYVVENIEDPIWSSNAKIAIFNGILAGISVVAGSHLLEGIALRNLMANPIEYLTKELGRLNKHGEYRSSIHHNLRMLLGGGIATYAGLVRICFFADYTRKLILMCKDTKELEYAGYAIGILVALPAGIATFCIEGGAAAELFVEPYTLNKTQISTIICTLIAHAGTVFFADTMALSVDDLIQNNSAFIYALSFCVSQIVVSSLTGKAIRVAYKKMLGDADGYWAGINKELTILQQNFAAYPITFPLLGLLLLYGSIFQGYMHAELSTHDSPVANFLRMSGDANYIIYGTCGILVNFLLVWRTCMLNLTPDWTQTSPKNPIASQWEQVRAGVLASVGAQNDTLDEDDEDDDKDRPSLNAIL